MDAPRLSLPALQGVFALNALGLAVWFPRIPDVKADLGLDVLTLAFCLFGLPAGTMLGFLGVGRITAALGVKRTAIWGGSSFLLAFILPGLAPNALALGLALFVCGLAIATIEVPMNAKASQMERALRRRVMTRCHAFWSLGAVTGALIGGAFAEAGVPFLVQQAILQPIFAAATVLCGRLLIGDEPPAPAPARGFGWPSLALVLLCVVPIGALLIEGAMMEWSALLLREHVGASPLETAATFSSFALTMAAGRLGGDWLAERLGGRPVVLASSALMGAAMLVFALSPSLWLSMPAAALVGAGCANIYPLTMSMVAPLPGQPPERNVATLALTAFTAFLIGPPFIGIMASLLDLPIALALLAPLGVLPFLIRRRATAEGARAAPRGRELSH